MASERRLARVHRKANAFAVECESRGLPRRGLTMVTLTVADPDEQLEGRVRALCKLLRDRWGKHVMLRWAELQARGVIHYHMILVDHPGRREGFSQQWLQQAWGVGHTWLTWRPAYKVKGHLVDDVVAYAKKLGRKGYQQAYDTFPRNLRACDSSRFTSPYARLAMSAPLVFETVQRIGFSMVTAATHVAREGWRFVARSSWGRSPPRELTLRPLVSIDRALLQGTLWGVRMTQGDVLAAA